MNDAKTCRNNIRLFLYINVALVGIRNEQCIFVIVSYIAE